MFTIGEFSRITGLTVKTLRFYHEAGVLAPSFVDPQSGYRYYDRAQVQAARIIAFLRSLDLSLDDIKEILRHEGEADALAVLERQRTQLRERLARLRKAARELDRFITQEKENQTMTGTTYTVEEKTV